MAHFVLTLALSAGLPAADWPQWRGPDRDGVWHEKGLPETLGKLTPRWRAPVGGGYGGIAATNGRVYLMDRQTKPAEVERVLCLDARDGRVLWSHDDPVSYGKLDYGNGPRATPTVHDGRVYAYGALGRLRCLDAADGRLLWGVDAVKDLKGRVPTWGHACSPLVVAGLLVVQIGGEPDACIVAFDRKTGREVWRALADRPGYSSPVLMTTKAGRQLVVWTAEHLAGLDPAVGKVLWKVAHTTNYDVTISDPVAVGDVLIVSDYWEGSKAVRVAEDGPKVVWEGKRLSLLMSTPLVRGEHAYALDRFNGLKCLEVASGKVLWEGEHVTPRGRNPQASLVGLPDGRALVLNEKGELILARPGPGGFKELGRAKLLEDTWAHPGFLDGCVFARNDREIVWRRYGDGGRELSPFLPSPGDMDTTCLDLDGSQGEGGGQILRTCLALSLLTGRPFRLHNVRARRPKPGLQPQHLTGVRAAATLGQAKLCGASLGSSELSFEPGEVVAGNYQFAIGTAGATGLVLQTIYLPLALRGRTVSELTLVGGTHVTTSPSFHFLNVTWRGYLARMGLNVSLRMVRPGFYPRGGGVVVARVEPCEALHGLTLKARGKTGLHVLSAAAGLPEHVAQRQARRARARLQRAGRGMDVEQEAWDGGPGSLLAVTVDNGVVPTLFFGLGARGRPSEDVADEAVDQALAYLDAGPAVVDPHSADQIVLPLALAQGPSTFTVSEVTSHLLTNVDVIRRFLPREIIVEGEAGGPGVVRIG